jgi:hypothetical protein
MNQAARKLTCVPAARSVLKYRSSVLTAASRTIWQSAQVSRWRLISPSTDVESRPSKYQQIRWIVSLQLISPVPQIPERRQFHLPMSVHFLRQKPSKRSKILSAVKSDVYGTLLDFDAWRGRSFLKRLHLRCFKYAETRQNIVSAAALRSSLAELGSASQAGDEC